ncbi:MAG: methylenetetrahydrofolate reductase [bacterium]|nr:methylenetetrahydrofolate reductase [bacterium]
MKITDLVKTSTGPFISIEIIPPRKGVRLETLFAELEALMAHKPAFMSVTSHAHEWSIEKVDGKEVERMKHKRLDTNAICIAAQARFGIEPTPHIICRGFTKDETEDVLLTLHFHGIENVLALRGDGPPTRAGTASAFANEYASDLVEQIQRMNQGLYLDPIENADKTDFCIGVAGYPEKHFEAPDMKTDLANLKKKVDAGAHFIITQMFFDNEAFYRFRDEAKRTGINVPIIPGIKPLYKKEHLEVLPRIFHTKIPQAVIESVSRCDNPDDAYKAGIESSVAQCKDLLAHGVPGIHFYSMSVAKPTSDVLRGIKS